MLYTKQILEQKREYHLIVCGGGFSGFAAALAAGLTVIVTGPLGVGVVLGIGVI